MNETSIAILSATERRQMGELAPYPKLHQELYARMPFRHTVEVRVSAGAPMRKAGTLRVLAWNAARCTNVDADARLIERANADIVLLTEMDWGMARSGQLHTARETASRLRMGYAYAVEFLELGLGDEREKEEFRGAENSVGYHGAAILAPHSFARVARFPLEESGGWFDPGRGQRRVGGRIALLALLMLPGGSSREAAPRPLLVCSVHLESESDPLERAREIDLLMDRVDEDYAGTPVVIGGDFNTFSIAHAELHDPATVRLRKSEDPVRFSRPEHHEPLFERAVRRGYDWRSCNVPGMPTTRHSHEDESSSLHDPMKIDWFLCRGVRVREPEVIPAIDPLAGATLSDHDAIAVSVELS